MHRSRMNSPHFVGMQASVCAAGNSLDRQPTNGSPNPDLIQPQPISNPDQKVQCNSFLGGSF